MAHEVAQQQVSVHQTAPPHDISPCFGTDKRTWYAIQHAALGSTESSADSDRGKRDQVTRILLAEHPNLFANFIQPLWHPLPFPFPGHTKVKKSIWWDTQEIEDQIQDTMWAMVGADWLRKPIPECGYGSRSVLHSLFEDGAYLKPFLDQPALRLDMSQRDPLGRTLLHSICRNAVGADAPIDSMLKDAADHCPDSLISPPVSEHSLSHTVRNMGADLLAVDTAGKSILHHLLEARDSGSCPERPPCIRNTLHWILANAPILVNQPDVNGLYCLHSALQALRAYSETVVVRGPPFSGFEDNVKDLLEAGAETTVSYSRGNTALHYLAANGLAEQWEADKTRELFAMIMDSGVDVNARNDLGRTALEILMTDDWHLEERRTYPQDSSILQSVEQIDGILFDRFDKAGVRWTEQDPSGNTLLHLLARNTARKEILRGRVRFRVR